MIISIVNFFIKIGVPSRKVFFLGLFFVPLLPKAIISQQQQQTKQSTTPENQFKWLYSNQVFVSAFLSSHHFIVLIRWRRAKPNAMIKLIKDNAEKGLASVRDQEVVFFFCSFIHYVSTPANEAAKKNCDRKQKKKFSLQTIPNRNGTKVNGIRQRRLHLSI